MAIDIDTITNSTLGINALSAIAENMPRRMGYAVADFTAWLIAQQRRSRLVRAVRSNQWVVLGENSSKETLDRAVHETIRYSAHSIYDLYHYINDPEATGKMLVLDTLLQQLIKRSDFEAQGLMVVGPHIGRFDLIARWFSQQGIRPLVLTMQSAHGGRRVENEMRKQVGMNLVPATIAGLRYALRHLQKGGAVLTGLDRPIPHPKMMPRFFGRPAAVPLHHIYLASRAQVPVVVMATILEEDGRHHIRTSNFVEMIGHHDKEEDALRNAERVLQIAEDFIRRAPQQWSVPLPVWPAVLDLVPA